MNQAADTADILCEFFEVAIHNILYVRKLYPASIFTAKKKFGVPVYQCIHPHVNDYIGNSLKAVSFYLKKNDLKRLFVCIHTQNHLFEKYVFEVLATKNIVDSDPLLVEFEKSLRSLMLNLFTSEQYVDELPEDTTFSVRLQTTAHSSLELDQNPSFEDFPWVEIKQKANKVENADIIPVYTVESDVINFQLYIEKSNY
ncbi:unnamed protein product [Callosobruchus maculatus]|uniref:HORMA domain-containing protein n=1 Tax=Callosobruchus maculatus TaxID=64391 RepID=A0A653DI51_CALMS|nr:unnamed protein product [Callosobruchus maculatus]